MASATFDFPRATIVERGCGESRTAGGLYIEMGLSDHGIPFDRFLVDPPLEVPEGLDKGRLANKPQFWTDPHTGVVHVCIWIGQKFYSFCPDYIEESRRYGISRRISPSVLDRPEAARLTAASRLILVHPRARDLLWETHTPPRVCRKALPHHALDSDDSLYDVVNHDGSVGPVGASAALSVEPLEREGPCLFKLWDLIPADARTDDPGYKLQGRQHYFRRVGATEYTFAPTGESEQEGVTTKRLYGEGVFGAFPITCFGLVKNTDGSVDVQNQERLQRIQDSTGVPFYCADE